MIFRHIKKFGAAEGGVAAIETAMIMPFLLFLYFGMIDLTSLIALNRKITYSASVAADATSQNKTSMLKSATTDYYKGVELIMSPTPSSGIKVNLYGYRPSGSTAVQIWKTAKSTGPTCTSTPSVSAMPPLMTAGNDIIVAIACMQYTPYVATFLGENVLGATTFNLEQIVMLRPRSSLMLTCYQTTVGGAVCS